MLKKTLPWAVTALAAVGVPALTPDAATAKFGDTTLRKGSSGREVRVLQRWLTLVGFETRIDGQFGRGTVRSLRAFERAEDLRVDGRLVPREAKTLRAKAYAVNGRPGTELSTTSSASGAGGEVTLSGDGRTAVAPADAPQPVKDAVAAANAITDKPYEYGGGHGSFEDSGYDCSGAVSYVLRAAAGLKTPLDSSGLASYGEAGEGQWITVYAHGSHAYVVIGGLRFDTSGKGDKGPRWRPDERSPSGYTARHPEGL